jgi:hypothetical protein
MKTITDDAYREFMAAFEAGTVWLYGWTVEEVRVALREYQHSEQHRKEAHHEPR